MIRKLRCGQVENMIRGQKDKSVPIGKKLLLTLLLLLLKLLLQCSFLCRVGCVKECLASIAFSNHRIELLAPDAFQALLHSANLKLPFSR